MTAPSGIDPHTFTGAYAAHALDAVELAEFEEHLRGCAECQVETSELVATAARIGAAESLVPPADLRSRVMAEMSRTRQLPPQGRHGNVVELASRPPRRIWLAVAAAVAAIAVVGGGISGGVALREHSQTQRVEAQAQAVAAVLSAPDARTVTTPGPSGARAIAVFSDSRHQAVFSAAGMPAAGDGKTWQLWVIDASGAKSAGLLTRRADGSVAPVVSSSLPASGNFGVTLEPAGGSKQPTTKPVVLLPLQA